ncbi:hypothetical protein DLREEDagrD3_20310 [Denitratisoma sp. agr-D3]
MTHRPFHPLAILLALACWLFAAPGFAAPPTDGPVEIVSSQFGLFDASTPNELSFEPTNLVPRIVGQRYGWIIELKTAKRNVSVREEYLIALPAKADAKATEGAAKDEFLEGFKQPPQRRNQVSQRQLAPVDGQIYGEWSVGQNEPAGHRRLQVFVEGRLAATFEYDVR